ncbi:MAG: Teichoic acids export ATP-binding protein TagH [Parcubacteria group bacterium ADurb.Bin159]|jgi:ABC-type polysaccharide/polyol phosphate transport system ATPase subunit|nr:MAG: Teichoic acids export ATP-binding protein TagH [Parcubacteria group bacterium ADurb.Bin159]
MKKIIVKNVSKNFKIGFEKNQGVLARFISFFSGKTPQRNIKTLDNISFYANKGEILGIIGKNGSGKSTLLRIIAGIYKKDKGEILTYGKIIPLINLNYGLKERLTLKDNIYLYCSFFGLSKNQIKQKFDLIVEFAELKNFINTKIYQFSEGMKQRLAFSIAIHCQPEILLLDEVFEVGDKNFKQKSSNKIEELAKNGTTVLLVSHDINLINKHCQRTIWLEKGKIMKDDKTSIVIAEYLNSNEF